MLGAKDFEQPAFVSRHHHTQGDVWAIQLKAVVAKHRRRRAHVFLT
jgi:hypothetical protein